MALERPATISSDELPQQPDVTQRKGVARQCFGCTQMWLVDLSYFGMGLLQPGPNSRSVGPSKMKVKNDSACMQNSKTKEWVETVEIGNHCCTHKDQKSELKKARSYARLVTEKKSERKLRINERT